MKKSNPDSSLIGDLLKKLHASYFGDKKDTEKQTKKKPADTDDAALLNQLKATLDKASAPEGNTKPPKDAKKKETKKASHSAPPQKALPAKEAQEPLVEEKPNAATEPTEKKSAAHKKSKKQAALEDEFPRDPGQEALAAKALSEQSDAPVIEEEDQPLPEAVEIAAEQSLTEEPMSEESVTAVEDAPLEEPPAEVTEETEDAEEAEEAEEPAEEDLAETAPAPRKRVIVKRIKKQALPRAEAQAAKKETPGVSLPRISDAYDFSKKKIPDEEQPIVIRPKASDAPIRSESIVIRPRVSDYTPPRPTYDDASVPTAPITIEVMQKKEQIKKEPASAPLEPKATPAEGTHAPLKPKKAKNAVSEAPEPTKESTHPAEQGKPREDREELTEVLETEPAAELLEDTDPHVSEPVSREAAASAPPAKSKKISAFQRRQQHKQSRTEKSAHVSEIIHERSGLTDDDIAMMFELGYENELAKLVGYESMKQLHYEHLRRSSHSSRIHYRTAYGYRGEEYMGTRQREAVLSAYAHDKRKLIRRLILSALISVILFFIERPMPTGSALAGLFAKIPVLAPLIAIFLLLGSALLSRRELLAGVRSLMNFSPTPYSIAAITVSLSLAYSGIALILRDAVLPTNFLASLFLVFITSCDALRVCTELRAFRILSVNAEKTVLEVATPRKKKLRHSDKIVKVINDDVALNLYRVRTADQTAGFFRRFNNMTEFARPTSILTGLALAAAFLVSFVTAILTASIGASAQALLAVFFVSLPSALVLNLFYPLYRANKQLSRWNCTLVGEEAVRDFSKELTVIFDDTDLYHIEKYARVSVREDDDFRRDIRLVEILFRKIGGTLATLGGKPQLNDPPVSVVRVASNGIEAVIDSNAHILLGSIDFLRKNGISVSKEIAESALYCPPHTAKMYAAIDGTLKLSYELEYRNNTEFEDTIAILASDGNKPSIHSHDPNLTDDFLRNSRRGCEDPIGVTRPSRFEPGRVEEVVDTGAVSLGGKETIALPLHAAKEIKAVRRREFLLQLIASLLGISLVSVLTILGQADMITPIGLTLYQLLWLTVSVVHTRASLSRLRLYL